MIAVIRKLAANSLRFAILCFAAFSANAQSSKTSIAEFITGVDTDTTLAIQKEKTSFLKSSGANAPLIDDIELRVRNDAFELGKQRYTLRLEPRGVGETRAGGDVYHTERMYHKGKENVLMNELLTDRYTLVIEFLYFQAMLSLHKKLMVLYEDRIKVLKKHVGSTQFDLNDVIEAEDKLTKLKFENIEREKDASLLQQEIGSRLPGKSFKGFDTAAIIDAEAIGMMIERAAFAIDTGNVYLKLNMIELSLTESRLKLETAEGRRYISFLEFSYDHGNRINEIERRNEGKDFDLNQAYRAELGIRIPYINTDRLDINRRKLRSLSERENYRELKAKLEERVKKDVADIKTLASQYKYLKDRKNNVNAESSLKRYMQMQGIDPIILLSIKESILENDIKLEKIRFDILRNYIRILDATGQISKRPLRNFLSKDQEIMR